MLKKLVFASVILTSLSVFAAKKNDDPVIISQHDEASDMCSDSPCKISVVVLENRSKQSRIVRLRCSDELTEVNMFPRSRLTVYIESSFSTECKIENETSN